MEFEALRARYTETVRVHTRRGRSPHAEDIEQRVWLRIWQHLDQFDPATPIEGRIGRVAKNATIDHYRTAQRQKRGGHICFVSEDALLTVADQHPSPFHWAWRRQQMRLVMRGLLRLCRKERQAVLAWATGRPIPGVGWGITKNRAHRGLRRIRAEVNQ